MIWLVQASIMAIPILYSESEASLDRKELIAKVNIAPM